MNNKSNGEILSVLPKHTITIDLQYTPEDKYYLKAQERHLAPLISSGLIALRDREKFPVGELRDFTHFEDADMIISFLSSYLLDSPNCCGIDMQHMSEKHLAGEVYALAIYIGSCAYHGTPIAQVPIIKAKGEPITHWKGNDRQAAYAHIAEEICKIVEILLTMKWKVTVEQLYEQHCYDQALEACNIALQFYQKNPSFHSDITDTSLLQGFYDALVTCYTLQAQIFISLNQFGQALVACNKGIELQKHKPLLHLNKGCALSGLHRFQEAIEAFRISVNQLEDARKQDANGILYKEDLVSAYEKLGKALEDRGEQVKQELLQEALKASITARNLREQGL